ARHKTTPNAVIELKGPTVNVDRDRFNGRTPVQQCWDYLNALPDCPWGIVCNYVSFRLYHREQTPRAFELFTLHDLRKADVFRRFYCLFQRDGLLPSQFKQIARAADLLDKSLHQEREVGDQLYKYYRDSRVLLIQYLMQPSHNKPLESAIRIAQKLLDRVIFIAFCEDRGLLPANSLKKAWEEVPPFARVTNPRWQNFLNLFHSIDKGNPNADIAPYNGGLFRPDPEVDDLQIEDEHTNFFKIIGSYDFRDEINVDVLGHLFERSLHDVERLRTGGLFGEIPEEGTAPKMSKSAERKRFGIYYTPPDFTSFITYNTISRVANERFDHLAAEMSLAREQAEASEPDPKVADYWAACLQILRDMKIVGPACGSGAFLIQAYDVLEELYADVLQHLDYQGYDTQELRDDLPDIILNENIHGVDLSAEAVEITQLALWIRSANKGKTLADLSHNIVCGNSLVSDPKVDLHAMVWEEIFPQVFSRSNKGFDCVIGNPPWERIKLQEREFFDGRDNNIATAVSAAKRRELIGVLEQKNPQLYALYEKAGLAASANLDYVRSSGRYPLTGKGDINTYAAFAELAHTIVGADGMVGLLVPSGIATDKTTKDFFATLVESKALAGLYDFENKAPVFTDVHRSFKFSVLLFTGSDMEREAADFVFFAHRMEELRDRNRHIALSPEDIELLNPNTHTCPVFRSNRDAEITKAIYRRAPVLIDRTRKEGGNPWGIKFVRMFDQTNNAELFNTADQLKKDRFKRAGPNWRKGKKVFVPLYEAKMIQMYDHRAASVVVKDDNWMRQGQTAATAPVSHQNPEYSVESRWWVSKSEVVAGMGGEDTFFIGFKDITSPTNQRTMIAAAIPFSAVTNHFVLIRSELSPNLQMCLLANLNAFAFDFVTRQKIGGVTLNFFIVEQLPTFTPDFYDDPCPWHPKETLEQWISQRVLKLTCTSNDMIPLAEAAGFDPPVHKWKTAERA
ncbi:MAG: DNA methyltransferase, partial [Desulfobacteria bacterium]